MPFHDEVVEQVVHHGLKGRRAVGKSEIHHQWFVESAVCPESSFPFIAFLDSDIVVSPSDIELGEEFGSPETMDQIVYERKWVTILFCDFIESLVVLYEAESAIFLFNKKYGGSDWGFRWSNSSGFKGFFEEGVKFRLLVEGHGVYLGSSKMWSFGGKFDGVVPSLTFW